MIHEKTTFRPDCLPLFARDFLTEDMLLFDIETTGLSPARDQIYCIGCGYLQEEEACVELFFAAGPEDEEEVLRAFFQLADSHPVLITFNGTTFDLPFLRQRAAVYAMNDVSEETAAHSASEESPEGTVPGFPHAREHIDLYREARAMRGLLELPSYRQKSIEQFLGCEREDRYSGGELIEFYQQYVVDPDPELLKPILLHNQEDVRGMFDLLSILAYRQFGEGRFDIVDQIEEPGDPATICRDTAAGEAGAPAARCRFLNVKLCPEVPLPQSIHRIPDDPDGISVVLDRDLCLVRFPVCHGTLKYFFDDPANYYYLPAEDTAVHKSVGGFVDPSHRQKATRATCYTKKESDYLEIPVKPLDGCLRKEFQDRHSYLALPAGPEDLKEVLTRWFACFPGDA